MAIARAVLVKLLRLLPSICLGLILAAPAVAALTSQTIAFGLLANLTFGASPFTIVATASSGLPVSFAATTSSICTVSNSTVTLVAAGTCTVQASQAGNAIYAAAPKVSQSFAVGKASQTITFGALGDKTAAMAPFTISATASSALAVTFLSVTKTVCTFGGGKVTLVAVGTCIIQAAQAGNANYDAAPSVSQTFNVIEASQTIVFGALANKTYGAAAFNVSASTSSGLTVTFTSTTTPVCTISGTKVTIVAASLCTIQASQAGDAMYAPAPNVSQSFAVTRANQIITFGSLSNKTLGAAPFTINASASSGLAVRFTSTNEAVCTISGDTVTLIAAAICNIDAAQTGNANFNAAPDVTRGFTITSSGKSSQTITFGAVGNHVFGAAPFIVSATASSGLSVTFGSLTAAVCTISGSTVTVVTIGTCTIRASQPGNTTYAAAPTVDQTFVVGQGNQTINFAALSNQALSAALLNVSATASSGLAVSFASLTASVCTASGNTVTLVSIGACSIRASQAGNTTYAAAPSVDQSFAVTLPRQAITFGPLSAKPISASPLTISATASSGLPVSFSSLTTTVCSVNSNKVTLLLPGSCAIRAAQAGNTLFAPAPNVDQSFTVSSANEAQLHYVYDAVGNAIQVTRTSLSQQPDLTISNLSVGKIIPNADGTQSIPVTFQVANIGRGTAVAPWYDRGYLSADGVLRDTDQVLGGYSTRSVNLGAGANYPVSTTLTTSANTQVGKYTLIVKTDGGSDPAGQFSPTRENNVAERDETNNTQAIAVTLNAPQADLMVTAANVGTIVVNVDGSYTLPVNYTVKNIGAATAPRWWYDMVYLSTDATLDNADAILGGGFFQGASLAANASYTVTNNFTTTASTASGPYTLLVKTDGRGTPVTGGGAITDGGNITEADETNNAFALALTLPVKPDLTMTSAHVDTIVRNPDGSYNVQLTYTVNNIGGAAAQPWWYDVAYLSIDATLDTTDTVLASNYFRGTALAAGANYIVTNTFKTAAGTAAGNYTLFLKTDGRGSNVSGGGTITDNGNLAESNETNNVISLSVTLP